MIASRKCLLLFVALFSNWQLMEYSYNVIYMVLFLQACEQAEDFLSQILELFST